MLIRVIRNVETGLPVNDPPTHVHPDTGRVLIAAGIAIEVPKDCRVVITTANGRATCDTVDSNGQVIHSSRPAPNAKWQIIPEVRKSGDWVQAPYMIVSCTSCGIKEIHNGPKAYEPKLRHCNVVTEPRVGNYVKATIDACPEAIAKEYKRLYELWASENKSASSVYSQEDMYRINWARRVDAQDAVVARKLERTPQEGGQAESTGVPNLEAIDRTGGTAWQGVLK